MPNIRSTIGRKPGHGRANPGAGHRQLGNWSVDNALIAKLGVQSARAGEDANPNIFADEKYARVSPHLFG